MSPHIAVVYYSATGTVHRLAEAVADGAAGGNPYGTSFATGVDGRRPDEAALAAARHQGRRLAEITARLAVGQPYPAEAGARS